MGKSTFSMAIFNSRLLVYQRVRNNENPREIKLVMGKTVRMKVMGKSSNRSRDLPAMLSES